MKGLRILCLSALTLFASLSFADTSATENLLYDGSIGFQEINMTTEKTRTEYRQVRVPATCYRTEYRRTCRRGPTRCQQVCNRRGVCRNVCHPGQMICRNRPVQVPYRCMRTETRAIQVHDYYVETKAKFEFNAPDLTDYVREDIKLKMTGETDKLTVKGSKNYILLLERKDRRERMGAGVKYLNLTYKVKLIPARYATDVLNHGIQNVKLKRGILTYTLGKGFNLQEFGQKIKLLRRKTIGRDVLRLEKYLTANEMQIVDDGVSTKVTVNIRELGVKVPKKLRLKLRTEYNIDHNKILNPKDVKTYVTANKSYK